MPPILKRRLRKITLLLLTLYILSLAITFAIHLPDQLIITPATGPLDHPNAERSMLPYSLGQLETFTALSKLATQQPPSLYILFFVGNEDRVDLWTARVAQSWEDATNLPTEVCGVNLPGFGDSTGPAYLSHLGPAGLAAFDALHARANKSPIVIQAASLGTLPALCIAANRPGEVAALSIQDPPPLRDLILARHGWWNAWLFAGPIAFLYLPSDINSITNASRSTAPCLFITSEHDTVIPPPIQQLIINAYAGPKKQIIIKNGHHCAQPDPPTAAQIATTRHWLLTQP